MSVLMKIVFSLSLSGSLLILILLLCKPLFRNRFSRQWQYYIWLVVIARLMIPAAPEVSIVGTFFSGMNRLEQAGQTVLQQTADSGTAHGSAQAPMQKEDIVLQYQESGQNGSRAPVREISIGDMKEKLLQDLWIPWLMIALLLLLRRITLYQSFVKYIRAGHAEVSDTVLLDRLAQIAERVGVRRPVELYVNRQVPSPLLTGFFRPCIVLPAADLPEEDFTYTVQHELIHYKRKDMFYKWLVQLTVCLHWFNPLVWLMGREINRACEFSCDEAVIRSLGEEGRRAYGDTLFRAMAAGGGGRDLPVSVTLNESVGLLKERLGAIMNFRKGSKLVTTVSIVSAVAMMMGATVMGAYVEPVRTAGILQVVSAETSGEHSPDSNDIDTEGQGGGSLDELARRYYESGMVIQFGAVFAAMDISAQRKWLDQVYADDEYGFFSAVVNRLDSNSPLVGEYAERAYVDNEISYFAIVTGSLDSGSPLIGTYAERAYADGAIDFFSVLTGEMDAEQLKSWQDRAEQGDMDINFRTILMDSDDLAAWGQTWKQKAEQEDQEQYQEWGITREGGNFYYQDQLVRVFFDQYDGEQVIRTLQLNPAGTVDVKVTRSVRNKIISVTYMAEEEVTELFGTEELSGRDLEEEGPDVEKDSSVLKEGENFDPDNDVYRLTQEELPDEVIRQMMDNGAVRTWYVYHSDGRQYLCYRGFAWSYGYRVRYDEDGWQVEIQRFQKKDSGDVFLALPDNGAVTVYCDGEKVELTEVSE